MGANLITLQEYKAYEGITGTTQDVEINTIIPKVSEFVKNICRRTFVDWVDDAKTEVFNGGTCLLLGEAPIIAISGIEKSENYGQTYTDLVEFTDWVLDSENQQILPIGASEFRKLINGYRVTYTAGYETIPEDLKLALLDLVTYYMKNQGAVQSQIAVTTGNAQVQYLNQSNLPGHIKRVLDLYVLNYN
jgi:hypothetical protein